MIIRNRAIALAILVLAGLPYAARALEVHTAPSGVRWTTGGIGTDERAELATVEKHYSLKIVLSIRSHRAYAADARFVVRGVDGDVRVEGETQGPWTLVDLPPGDYQVEVSSRGETLTRPAQIRYGGATRLDFQFQRF